MISSLSPFQFYDTKVHHKILRGFPERSLKEGYGVGKFNDFLALNVNISKTVADTAKVTISN